MRLDRLLASLGLGSRAQVKQMIRAGRVTVSGRAAVSADEAVQEGVAVCLDGQALDTRLDRHLMMNKPAGVLTAARDTWQATVMDLLESAHRALGCMPIGRLDKDTEGLLLFTTDGQAAHRLLAPGKRVGKRYEALVTGCLGDEEIRRFQEGIRLSDFLALPAELTVKAAGRDQSLAEVTVYEGKFHQVRRMFGACGHEVLRLKRLQFGPLLLDEGLSPGQWRELTDAEWMSLMEASGHDS